MNCDNCGEDLQQSWICCPTCGYCSANNLQATGVGITFNLSSDFLVAKEAIDKMIEQMSSQDWELTHGDPERVAAIQKLIDAAGGEIFVPQGPYQALVNKTDDLPYFDESANFPDEEWTKLIWRCQQRSFSDDEIYGDIAS